jgi:hypothetical protein
MDARRAPGWRAGEFIAGRLPSAVLTCHQESAAGGPGEIQHPTANPACGFPAHSCFRFRSGVSAERRRFPFPLSPFFALLTLSGLSYSPLRFLYWARHWRMPDTAPDSAGVAERRSPIRRVCGPNPSPKKPQFNHACTRMDTDSREQADNDRFIRKVNGKSGRESVILERAFGSATKRHKRRKEIEREPQCLAMNPFTQQVKHSRNNSVTSLRCFVLRVPSCGHSTAGFGVIQ